MIAPAGTTILPKMDPMFPWYRPLICNPCVTNIENKGHTSDPVGEAKSHIVRSPWEIPWILGVGGKAVAMVNFPAALPRLQAALVVRGLPLTGNKKAVKPL